MTECDDAVSRKAVRELAHSQIRGEYAGISLKEQRDFMIRVADNIIDLLAPVIPTHPDYVKVIRCKDCEHFRIGKDGKTGVCGGKIRTLDFWCADGEKAQ